MKHPILIQGAMTCELDRLLASIIVDRTRQLGAFVFYEGSLNGIPLVVGKTMIGEINAAISTTLAIDHYAPCLILNQGTAGAHSTKLHTGDVVIGESICYLSQFSQAPNREAEPLNPWKADGYRSIDGERLPLTADPMLLEELRALTEGDPHIHVGCIGSGDVWSGKEELKALFRSELHTLCEEMECAGAYLAANSRSVPIAAIRVISNNELLGEPFDPMAAGIAQALTLRLIPRLAPKFQ